MLLLPRNLKLGELINTDMSAKGLKVYVFIYRFEQKHFLYVFGYGKQDL